MPYRAVVTDLDGTLLNPQGKLSFNTIATLKKIHNVGVELILATGRHPQDAKNIARTLDLPVWIVGLNGAQTLCNTSNKVIDENYIGSDCVSEVLAAIEGKNVHLNIFDTHGWKVFESNKMSDDYARFADFPYALIFKQELNKLKVNKLVLWVPTDITDIEQDLRHYFAHRLEFYRISSNQLEIGPPNISKATAVIKLLASRGINFQSQAIAFGDGWNDLSMLSQAAQGVVMCNASPEFKAMLHSLPVTLSNSRDGVANYLNKIFNL